MDSRGLKKRLYIDMDGVLCDFLKSHNIELEKNPHQPYPQSQFGFFLNLEPIPCAIESLNLLKEHFDVWILTRPSVHNLSCYTEKAQWIRKYLGFEMQTKTIMCVDKSLLKGHFLVDDQVEHGQSDFEGKHIHFDSNDFPTWNSVVEYLLSEKDFITIRKDTLEFFGGC
jgi:5'(3')-deoxyribonucleotidase